MPIFTGIILAGFAAYCLAWYFGANLETLKEAVGRLQQFMESK